MMISIITVCFNAEQCIDRTVKSVVQQSNADFEYLIIDGASTDSTMGIVKSVISHYGFPESRFVLISEKDKGIYDAMNKGVRAAHGDYILFMNAGDIFHSPFVIADFEKAIQRNQADGYYGETVMVYRDGYSMKHDNDPVMPFSHQAVIVKRNLLMEHPFDLQYRIIADHEFFYWMHQNSHKLLHVPFIVANYEAEEGVSAIGKYRIALERDRIYGLDKKPFYFLRRMKHYLILKPIMAIKEIVPYKMMGKILARKRRYDSSIQIWKP